MRSSSVMTADLHILVRKSSSNNLEERFFVPYISSDEAGGAEDRLVTEVAAHGER